jgi:hypothetical protein
MKEALKQDNEMNSNGSLSRRKFLNYAGAIAGAGVLIASCKKKTDDPAAEDGALDIGSNDTGLLNLAYLFKQMKAAFYTQVVKTPYPGMTDTEMGFYVAMRNHEIAHRELFKNYLGTAGVPSLENDFSSIDFGSKSSVMAKAQFFEETSTSAMCDICRLAINADNLNVLAKITMVDARHSAIANDFIYLGSFSYKADDNGMQVALDPQNALEVIRTFFKRKLAGTYLPKY